ncbi:glycerate kinase [Gaoshiqia sediminis]|uniref:Glycerate kinase n=1 Tax=Gaoshiqia sediminis TaxID=2986998 RepID=A0AA41YBZ6_9BACT|nr:glycerate kinase [Gaoshiqia sediminis]MCW0482052.1 glycerate kinase [Gaoshiqia sediminis]
MFPGPTSKYRVIAAPNSMKGSLDAFLFAEIIGKAFRSVSDRFEVIELPVADGGDFTAEVLIRALQLSRVTSPVHDPLGRMIEAEYGFGNQLAVVEMANASGLKLLSLSELTPLDTSSIGTGELIRDAVERGANTILLGVGGSATIDGGMGLLEGLGVSFYDEHGERIRASGANAGKIHSWDEVALSRYDEISVKIICDVDNPLLGASGAVAVFGPQKGATGSMMPVLEKNLEHLANVIFQKKGLDLKQVPGMGAAGGINLALCGFLKAELVPGAEFILDVLNFDNQLPGADLVITGEGRIDAQTANNKAPFAVARRARQRGIPVVAIGGEITPEGAALFDETYSLVSHHVDRQTALQQTERLVYDRARQAAVDFFERCQSNP